MFFVCSLQGCAEAAAWKGLAPCVVAEGSLQPKITSDGFCCVLKHFERRSKPRTRIGPLLAQPSTSRSAGARYEEPCRRKGEQDTQLHCETRKHFAICACFINTSASCTVWESRPCTPRNPQKEGTVAKGDGAGVPEVAQST